MVARVISAAIAVLWLASSPAAAPGQDLSTRRLVGAAARYVTDYQARFKFLVADEEYRQATFDADRRQTGERRMRGELFLAYLAANDEWIAVHDFAEVDGQPVGGRDELRALLRKGEVQPVARRLADRNAQYNIGRIARNFNEPTLALLIFSARRLPNFSFDREISRSVEGRTLVTLSFHERERPTLIRGTRGTPMFSKGEILLDAATGHIERTMLELDDAGVRVRLLTEYGHDAKLDLWLPAAFTERYESTRGPRELIVCEAHYTNYRRFEVIGRIK